jgi:hypothetical protein
MKSTPEVYFTNILQATLARLFYRQKKITKQNRKLVKASENTFELKSFPLNVDEIDTLMHQEVLRDGGPDKLQTNIKNVFLCFEF